MRVSIFFPCGLAFTALSVFGIGHSALLRLIPSACIGVPNVGLMFPSHGI
jgi:hypothetical protein